MSRSYSRKKIVDEFTDLPVSRQYKYQLRHPERYKAAHNARRRKQREGNNEAQTKDADNQPRPSTVSRKGERG